MKITPKKNIKAIVISDGTGETATNITRAVMTQFPGREVFFTRYKNIRSIEQIDSVFNEATLHHDLIIYTIVSQELRNYIIERAKKDHVRCVDLLGPMLEIFSNVIEEEPKYQPGLLHAVNDEYFKRVGAMEFTLNHDDAKNLQSLDKADIILVGISRTSKTPLSIYLSLEGRKVVNIPIVLNTELPKQLFEIDQRKIFALTIDADALCEIRKNRLTRLGIEQEGDYANIERVHEEIEWANKVFENNRRWPVFNVTGKALEEIAAEIIKLVNMRQSNQFKQSKRFQDS